MFVKLLLLLRVSLGASCGPGTVQVGEVCLSEVEASKEASLETKSDGKVVFEVPGASLTLEAAPCSCVGNATAVACDGPLVKIEAGVCVPT